MTGWWPDRTFCHSLVLVKFSRCRIRKWNPHGCNVPIHAIFMFHVEKNWRYSIADDYSTLVLKTWKKKVISGLSRDAQGIVLVPEPLSFCRDCGQCITHLGTSDTARCIDYVTNLETVKLTGWTYCVRAHVIKPKPVSDLQGARQFNFRRNTIDRVAGRSP